ncbi:MAG: TetR/AcrR family transcriptional regulator [Proteobacteria bacterium]|nr:TetR/AcrR family transcriptional regulator [Pseudomonadota bacterium]
MSSPISETKVRILQACLKLLVASEGKDVRMSDIAKEAGVSRQALYLHFATRVDLLIATTLYLDEVKGSDDRLVPSRTATSGLERLDAFVEAWANYIPEVYPVGKALLVMKDTDEAAATAWNKRMQDMREGCEAAVLALKKDGQLNTNLNEDKATDILWTLLSIRNWEQLTRDCGWSQAEYAKTLKALARKILLNESP